ncbi:MAG: NADH-quinone oxidoreductase subunit NuoE [Bacteroidales bacterium]|jgi:NADH-quinone oxidoreductase subunit E/NADP-reducing hydrogenase subunit HndA|nr:NADH-quinone oxidoreductase subunit NuoE [Bacteroidales bacterium]HPB36473.1 NADH-quinone oxidoreductase subunit NuoE [Bacteroidales bacterium]
MADVHAPATSDKDSLKVTIKLSVEKINAINRICASYDNDPEELISVLHETQNTLGYLPAEVQEIIAHNLKISAAHVYGVVTFYSYFTMVPKGNHPISVCMGTACYVRGAEKILDELKKELNINIGETTPDQRFSISCLRCVGACGLAPVMMVGEKVYGRVSPNDVRKILEEYREDNCEECKPTQQL